MPREFASSFVQTVVLQRGDPVDRAWKLFARCDALASTLFDRLGATGAPTRAVSEEHTEEVLGPRARTIVTHTRGDATYRLVFERMFNGHLGANEDDLTLELERGQQRMTGAAQLLMSDDFVLRFSNEPDAAPITEVFVEALGLSS